MTTYKVRYKKYLVNLYLPEKPSGRAVMLIPGLPMSMNVEALVRAFLETGATVYYPYLSGSFDSGGSFSASHSIQDVAALYPLTQMSQVTELYFGKQLTVGAHSEVMLAGISYGAAVALLGHRNLYKKVMLLSPALLFKPSEMGEYGKAFREQMESLLSLLANAHPYTYRIALLSDLKQFLLGNRVGKREVVEALNELKCPALVVHGNNDTSIPARLTQILEREVTNNQVSWKYVDAGHSSSSYGPEVLEMIKTFVTS